MSAVIGATPWLHDPDPVEFMPGKFMYPSRERREEIALWLAQHPEVTAWCTIDDDEDAGPTGLVLTGFEQGLTMEAAELVIDALLNFEAHARIEAAESMIESQLMEGAAFDQTTRTEEKSKP